MKIDKTEKGYIITKEGDELITQNEWSDEIYERTELEIDNVDEFFEEFINNGSVVIELNKQEPTLQQLASEPIKESAKVELPKVDLGSLVLDNKKSSSTTEKVIAEDFEFEELLEPTHTIGEVLGEYFDRCWFINKVVVTRGYASYESTANFKVNGRYYMSTKHIAGPKIKYLESVIAEMKINKTGAEGLPVVDKVVREDEDSIKIAVISNEQLIIKYLLKSKNWFLKQKQTAMLLNF